MAIANYSAWIDAIKTKPIFNGSIVPSFNGGYTSVIYGKLSDVYTFAIPTLTVPSTAVACDRTTSGAFGQINTTSGDNYLIGMEARYNRALTVLLVDRLSHQGGLSGNTTGAQTANLPTAALTRYTSGEGVWIGVQLYTSIGSTASTISVSYTNSGGTSGRTSPGIATGVNAGYLAPTVFLIPLQAGDTGVRSVESLTFSAATGAAGNVGVTLFKPLAMLHCIGNEPTRGNFVDGNLIGGIPAIPNDACLWRFAFYDNNINAGHFATTIQLTES